jgi:tetratricopeptide (TPR) repeat protein
MPVVESNAKARTAAQKALAIDETLAEAHASLAYTLAFYDWNWEAAEREFKRAIELNPNYATAYQWYFEYLTVMGRFDEGWVAINKALELDPSSPPINGDVATYYYLTRQNDKTIEQARKLIELEPNYPYGYIFLFLGFYEKGMQDEAVEAFLRMEKLFYDQEETTVNELKEAYEKSGWKGFWQKRIEIMDRDREKKLYLAWDYIVPYIDIGEKEKAIQAFQQSYKDRDRWIVNLKYLPQFDPIRSDPRFQEIVRKIGLE